MALQTNLNVSPYFDDFNENKDFYKILFKPGVSVQVRELNQIQSIFQNQVEKFGDNIFKSGAIVSGVNFSFQPNYQYVRLSDLDINGVPTIPQSYVGMFIQSANTNLRARVIEAVDGYETTAPNTKTLYIEYVNSGDSGDRSSYSSGEILTVTNANNSLFAIAVNNGGSGFTNNDTVVISSSIAVNPLSGNFNVNDTVVQGDTGATAVVTDVLTGQFGTSNNYLVLRLTPRTADLENLTLTTTPWNFSNGSTITNGSAVANVAFSIGRNATAAVVTDASGYVLSLPVTNIGYGYTILPNIVIKPTLANAGIATFSAAGINYAAKIKIPSGVGSPSGTGYSMSVTEGYIYQKGYFLKVQSQSVIVNKYNDISLANNVSVVFTTSESIVTSNIDTSLLDNILTSSTGISTNSNAPGADRMKLVPTLTVVSTTDANASELYYSLVDFSEGKPFKQNRFTAYNEINNELARRTNDEAGSYVTDEFISTTRSSLSGNAATFSIAVDPGKAYISGYRVETVDNYYSDTVAGINTDTANSAIVSLNYGNYIRVSEMGGYFNFYHGDTILFDSAAVGFNTNGLVSVPSAPASFLAKANIRSVVLESGVPGTATAVYRIYLFNMIVSQGYNFKDAKSIYFVPSYNTTTTPSYWTALGVADLVLVQDPVTAANVAAINYANTAKLLFSSGTSTTLQNANNVTYTYRTSNNNQSFSNAGIMTISYAGSSTDKFPYTGSLTSSQMMDLILVPSKNLISYSALSGASASAVTNRASNTITATSGQFISQVSVGDYLYFEANSVSANINPSQVNSTTEYIYITNNPFSNGDAVLYLVATGNTAITGLSNNATYYVYNSNSSAFKLVSSAGNTTPINLTAGVSETGHQFSTTTAINAVDIKRVVSIANNSQLQLSANPQITSSAASVYRVFPQNVPMPFGSRSGLSASVNSNSQILTVNTGFTFRGSTSVNASATYNVTRYNIGAATKTAVRNIPVKITTSNNPGGTTGPWCLGCPDIFRLRSVILNNADVTSHFYIDHNQNPDFLDLGYLYLEPQSSLVVPTNAEIKVVFDAFINPNPTNPSYFVSQSYVGSNSAQQFINDSLDLTTLTANSGVINTNEVPELYSSINGYFNLLNQIDFRPSALPTININAINTTIGDTSISYSFDAGGIISTGTIPIRQTDPVSTVVFANNVNTDLHFPLPDSTLTADFTYYLPRIDRVVVNKRGTIDVIEGSPSVSPAVSAQPVETMLVDNILIPDYPSIPKNPDRNTLSILDTKMANERYSTTRIQSHIVKSLLSTSSRAALQPKGYTMADIGNLERRIKDIEYYISLSQLEQSVKNQVIPSTVTANVDRFKYGFFVDDFSTAKYSDTKNPQYSATIAFNTLYPLADNINLIHGDQNKYSLNVVSEQPVVIQNIASYSVTPSPCVVTTGAPYALTEVARKQADGTKADSAVDSFVTPKFTSNTATATLYFYTYNSPVSLNITQAADSAMTSAKQVASTTDAIALTASEVTTLRNMSFFSDADVVLNTNTPTIANGYVTGCGKITINHIPVAGRYYDIKTTKGPNDTKWRWLLVYPVNTSDYTDCFYDSNPTVLTPLTTTTVTTFTQTTSSSTSSSSSTSTSTSSSSSSTSSSSSSSSSSTTSYPNTNLYLKSQGMSTTGTGIVSALTFSGFDPINHAVEAGSTYGGVDITSWTAIKNSVFGTNYVVDTVEDADGKFRTVYIPSSTVASAIRYDLYQKTGISYQILAGYDGSALIDKIHGFYLTYLSRPPELVGLYYYVSQIIVYGQTLAWVEGDIANAATNYTSAFGTPFGFKWNTTTAGVDVSSYSIPAVSAPSYQGSPWVFLRNGSLSSKNDTIESVSKAFSPVYQYFYDSSFTSLTKYYELFYVPSAQTLITGLNARFAQQGGGTYLGDKDIADLTTIYNFYWNIPTSISSVDGLGRAPDLDGFLYWVEQKYTQGYTIDQIKNAFFADSQAEVQQIKSAGVNSVPRSTGTISNNKATNYSVGTNSAQININSVTSPNTKTAITTIDTKITSTGSTNLNTTSSLTVSSTNNNGFVQPTAAVTYTSIQSPSNQGDSTGYYKGSDGNVYGNYVDESGQIVYYKADSGSGG